MALIVMSIEYSEALNEFWNAGWKAMSEGKSIYPTTCDYSENHALVTKSIGRNR